MEGRVLRVLESCMSCQLNNDFSACRSCHTGRTDEGAVYAGNAVGTDEDSRAVHLGLPFCYERSLAAAFERERRLFRGHENAIPIDDDSVALRVDERDCVRGWVDEEAHALAASGVAFAGVEVD